MLDKSNVEAFASAVKTTFGGTDMLVLNAGQARLSTFDDTSDAAWREELELKYFSVLNPAHAFLPQLEMSDTAAIVCSSSLLGRQPEPHLVATSSARAGQLSLVHGMAHELAPKGIRVNSILIGQVASTNGAAVLTPLRTKASPGRSIQSPLRTGPVFPWAGLERLRKPRQLFSFWRLQCRLLPRDQLWMSQEVYHVMSDKATVGEVVIAFLEECGVEAAFGVISIHNIPFLDAIGERGKIRYVCAKGEAGAVNMADAYAR